jgi:hypothetical protein
VPDVSRWIDQFDTVKVQQEVALLRQTYETRESRLEKLVVSCFSSEAGQREPERKHYYVDSSRSVTLGSYGRGSLLVCPDEAVS